MLTNVKQFRKALDEIEQGKKGTTAKLLEVYY